MFAHFFFEISTIFKPVRQLNIRFCSWTFFSENAHINQKSDTNKNNAISRFSIFSFLHYPFSAMPFATPFCVCVKFRLLQSALILLTWCQCQSEEIVWKGRGRKDDSVDTNVRFTRIVSKFLDIERFWCPISWLFVTLQDVLCTCLLCSLSLSLTSMSAIFWRLTLTRYQKYQRILSVYQQKNRYKLDV